MSCLMQLATLSSHVWALQHIKSFHLHGIYCSQTCTCGLITCVSHVNTVSPPKIVTQLPKPNKDLSSIVYDVISPAWEKEHGSIMTILIPNNGTSNFPLFSPLLIIDSPTRPPPPPMPLNPHPPPPNPNPTSDNYQCIFSNSMVTPQTMDLYITNLQNVRYPFLSTMRFTYTTTHGL